MKKILLFACLIVFFTPSARANFLEERDGFYTRFDAGYSEPHSKFNGNTLVRMGFGQRWYSFLRTDFMLTRQRFSMQNLRHTDTVMGLSSGQTSSYSAFITTYWDIISVKGVTPYVGLGGGASKNKVSDVIIGSALLKKGRSHTLAWHASAGIGIDLPKGLVLDIAYTYADLGSFQTQRTYNVIGSKWEASRRESLTTDQITIGLRYHF